jgi:hypothetical protein
MGFFLAAVTSQIGPDLRVASFYFPNKLSRIRTNVQFGHEQAVPTNANYKWYQTKDRKNPFSLHPLLLQSMQWIYIHLLRSEDPVPLYWSLILLRSSILAVATKDPLTVAVNDGNSVVVW